MSAPDWIVRTAATLPTPTFLDARFRPLPRLWQTGALRRGGSTTVVDRSGGPALLLPCPGDAELYADVVVACVLKELGYSRADGGLLAEHEMPAPLERENP